MHWEARFPPIPLSVGVIRGEIEAIARRCGLDGEALDDVRLAVSEAATNAVVHAFRDQDPPADGAITATAIATDGELFVVIADDGIGMSPRHDSPGLGLGIPIIASVSRRMEVVRREAGTAIYMTFPCPAVAAT